MEARLGHDLGSVRVHTDAEAARSAREVSALAYTVGNHVVFSRGQFEIDTPGGRRLLAHELTHVLQQEGAPPAGGDIPIGSARGPAEREADSIADAAMRPMTDPLPSSPTRVARKLQRMVFVDPAGSAPQILADFNKMCPGKFGVAGGKKSKQITADCKKADRAENKSCECLCDVAHDTKRQYRISVRPANATTQQVTLHDGKKATIPDTDGHPNTLGEEHPHITVPAAKGSKTEFGCFDPAGKGLWFPGWRILAHELCGHGRLRTKAGGPWGNRPGHDATITIANAIAAEHGGPPRGKFADTRQGESFLNPVGSRGKVVFKLKDGFHFEAP